MVFKIKILNVLQAIKEDLNNVQPGLEAIKATADELEQVSHRNSVKIAYSFNIVQCSNMIMPNSHTL